MHPQADTLWRGPRWTLALLLACLGMLGPFSIDTYLPAFAGIARQLGATPLQMQQTLSAYLVGFAVMNLFHGALSDSFGRRPVVLSAIAVFTAASVGCALSTTIGQLVLFRAVQGLSAGAGMVVSRAIIRDMFPPSEAQRVMSQVTIFFGVAPAVAPMVGGFLFVHADWHSIFWMLGALGAALWLVMLRQLPESLHVEQRQAFRAVPLLRGYWQMGTSGRFLALVFASGVPFNGLFVYVLSSPAWLGDHLRLAPTQFFWFFLMSVSGIMGGAWWSGRLAGRLPPHRQIRRGFRIMVSSTVANIVLNAVFEPHPAWALIPVSLFAFGWSLMVPVVTLLVLDQVPERRGMASSVQAFVGAIANAFVAGVISPAVMHSALALALASAGMLLIGLVAWAWVKPQVMPR
jgi:MFS transporter, DHA1 family, multidrug resistance protein